MQIGKKEKQTKIINETEKKSENRNCGFQAGAFCPRCKQGILDYNGLLNLQCPVCGLEVGYGYT
ncbi:MAG: hypothetical protein AB2L18_02760 [Anaerolineaceae bacterium]